MDPEPSTSKAATSKTSALDDHGATPSDEVQEAPASTSCGGVVSVQQQLEQKVVFLRPVTIKQIHQLFVATCRVKLRRCQVPVPSTPAVSNASGTVAEGPADSRAVRKMEQESDTATGEDSGSSSEEDDDVKVLATFPSSAPSTNNTKTAVTRKKGGKMDFQRKSSSHYCTVCKKTFSSKKSLKVHSRKHTGEIRQRCENCGRSFWSRSAFVGHIKARDQRNGVCPRKYKESEGGWRPKGSWKCKICGKRMIPASSYLRHMRHHRGEKPFKCGDCGKAFGTSSDLSRHRRIHSQVWQFTCVFCDKGFHYKCSYWTHLRGHTEEKPYFCVVDGCGMSFRQLGTLQTHRRLIHLKKY